MDVPKAVLWVVFLSTLTSCCVVNDVEYDPEKHSILCSTNLTIAERMIKELLQANGSAAINPHLYNRLIQGQLDDLMAVFRESAAEAYLKQTCHNHFCHPHVLGTVGGIVPEDIPRLLDVTKIHHVTSIQLQQEIVDLVAVNGLYGTYITAAYTTGDDIGLFEFASNALNEMKEFTSYPGTCLATTGNVWGPPLVIASSCEHPAVRVANKSPVTLSYVYKTSETGLEMMQILKSRTQTVAALDVYWRVGLPHVLLVASPTSFQFKWNNDGFVLHETANLPIAKEVASFRIGGSSYLALAARNRNIAQPLIAPNVFIYFSEEEQPTHYRILQRIPDCHAADVEHFTMSNLNFLLLACDQEDFSRIFWWTGSQFVLWQTVAARQVMSWTVARLPNLEVVLVAVEYQENSPVITFFQFESGYFWPIDQHIKMHPHRAGLSVKVASFVHNDSTYLVVAGRPILDKLMPSPEDPVAHIPLLVQGRPPSPVERGDFNAVPHMPGPINREGFPPLPSPGANAPFGEYQPFDHPYPLPPLAGPWIPPMEPTDSEYYAEEATPRRRPDYAPNRAVQSLDVLSVFRIIAQSRLAEGYSESTADAVRDCLVELDALVDSESQKMEHLMVPTNDTWIVGRPQTITGPKELPNGLHAENAVVNNLILGPNVHVQPMNGFNCANCEGRIRHINGELNRILAETSDLVQLSQPQVITASKKFRSVEVDGTFEVKSLTTGLVCGHNLPLLQANVLRYSEDQIFNNSIELVGDVTVDTLDIRGLVNGINLQRVATLTGSHTFTAPQHFRKIIAANVQVSGRLNNVDTTKMVVSDVPQTLKGFKRIRGNLVVHGNINVRDKINKVDLPDLANRFVTLHTPQTIPANVTFATNLTFHQALEVGMLRGIDLERFSKSVVNTQDEQVLEGEVTFNANVGVRGNVREFGLINNINLNTDVLTTRSAQNIEHDVTCLGDLFIRGDLDIETLNGIALSHEAVTTVGEQTISGRKVFVQPVKLLENLSLHPGKTVNNVDVSQVGLPIGTGPRLTVDSLNVDFINGRNVHHVFGNALRKSVDQNIHANYSFLDVTFEDVLVNGLVRGHKPERDFLTTRTEQHVKRAVLFRDKVVIVGNGEIKENKQINGHDLNKLQTIAVKTIGDQIIGGHKTFGAGITAPSVELPLGGRVNNMDLSEELFLLDKDQEIKGNFTAEEIFINELQIDANLNTNVLNDVQFADFLRRVVYVDGPKTDVKGKKEFLQDVTVRQQLDVKSVNGINLKDFESKIVRLSTTQTLAGNLTFKGEVFFNGPVRVDRVNGLKLSAEAPKLAVIENGKVQHPVKFRTCFNVLGEIKDLQYLNNRPINFIDGILSKSRPQVLQKPKLIAGDTIITNLFTGQLDGIVIDDIALVDQPTKILSTLVFKERLEVGSHVGIQGQLNGVFLDTLKKQVVLPDRDMVIHGHKTFRNIRADFVDVGGLLVGVRVADLPDRIVSKTKEQVIRGNVAFDESIGVFDLNTLAPVNGVQLAQLRAQALTKSQEQRIIGVKHFSNDSGIVAEKDLQVGDINRVHLIHGVDIAKEASRAVIQGINQTIHGPVTFMDETVFNAPLHVKGTINNLKIPGDVMMVEGEQFVQGTTTFQTLTARNIGITKSVNGVDLNHLIAKRATLGSNETISRALEFIDPITVVDALDVKGKMNNLDCHLDLVKTHKPQEVSGHKQFENVGISNLKTDFVNGLHWLVLFNRIDSVAKRRWVHMEDVTFEQDVKLEGRWLNDELIRESMKALEPLIQSLKVKVDSESKKLADWSQASGVCLNSLGAEISNLVTYVDYLDVISYLDSSRDIAVINFNNELHLLAIGDSTDCKNVVVYRCLQPGSIEVCSLANWPAPLPVHNTKSILAVPGPNAVFVVLGNLATSECPMQPSLTGTQVVIMRADSLSIIRLATVMMDAVAVLPGAESYLVALAVQDNLEVKQVVCGDVCEALDTNIKAKLYDAQAVAMKWFQIQNVHYLLVVNARNVTTNTGEVLSYIFAMNQAMFLVTSHTIYTTAATDGVTFQDHGRHYIAISSYDCTQDIASDRIDIFEVGKTSVRSVQKLPVSAVSLATAHFLDETYLFASYALDDVLVYRWEDFFKFRLWTRIPAVAPRTIEPFIWQNQLFITIASEGTPYNRKTSIIVRAVTKGIKETATNSTLAKRN